MVSDEEILERAFLSALRQHFKKPGPWLPTQTVASGQYWPSAKGVEQSQVWEVYVQAATAAVFSLNDIGLAYSNSGLWTPSQGLSSGRVPIEWTVAGAIYSATAFDPAVIEYSTASNGWILSDGDRIREDTPQEFRVRARRRFDLET